MAPFAYFAMINIVLFSTHTAQVFACPVTCSGDGRSLAAAFVDIL